MLFGKRHIEIEPTPGSECNHRPTAKNTTLSFINRDFLVFPPKYYAICARCGASFVFTHDDDGTIIPYIDNEEESADVDVK